MEIDRSFKTRLQRRIEQTVCDALKEETGVDPSLYRSADEHGFEMQIRYFGIDLGVQLNCTVVEKE